MTSAHERCFIINLSCSLSVPEQLSSHLSTNPWRNSTILQTNTLECTWRLSHHISSMDSGILPMLPSQPLHELKCQAVLTRKICNREWTRTVWYDENEDEVHLDYQKVYVALVIFPSWSSSNTHLKDFWNIIWLEQRCSQCTATFITCDCAAVLRDVQSRRLLVLNHQDTDTNMQVGFCSALLQSPDTIRLLQQIGDIMENQ